MEVQRITQNYRVEYRYIPHEDNLKMANQFDQNRALKTDWPKAANSEYWAQRRWLAFGFAKGTKMVRSANQLQQQTANQKAIILMEKGLLIGWRK